MTNEETQPSMFHYFDIPFIKMKMANEVLEGNCIFNR